MELVRIIRLMLTGDLPRDRELFGGLHLQYRTPDQVSPDYRLIAYRTGVRVGENELKVLARILHEQLPGVYGREVAAILDAQEYNYEDGGKRVRFCRVFRWTGVAAEQLPLPMDVPRRYD